MQCPLGDEIQDLLRRGLTEEQEARLRAHLAECAECAERSSKERAAMSTSEHQGGPGNPGTATAVAVATPSLGLLEHSAQPLPVVPGYEILAEINRGGQGIVYRARQQVTGRDVAIKVLLQGPYASEVDQKRFELEIKLVAHLRHPHIITVFDAGTTPDNFQYCVMDYVSGLPLNRYIRRVSPPLEDILVLFIKICNAVEHAHRKGVIHRDLKPSNILIGPDGEPKILDFGLARVAAGSSGLSQDQPGVIPGTLPYLSPEQARENAEDIDTRVDVYALGVILYQALTGEFPYPVNGQLLEVLQHIMQTPPVRPQQRWNPDSGVRSRRSGFHLHKCPIDKDLQKVMLAALAKEPDRRYQSAGELARDIQHYLDGEPVVHARPGGAYLLRLTWRRYRWRLVGATAVLAVVLGGLSYHYRTQRRSEARRLLAEASSLLYADPTVASERLRSALSKDPGLHEAQVQYVALLLREGSAERALSEARGFLASDPDNGPLHVLIHSLCIQLGDKACAQEHADAARAYSEKDPYYEALAVPPREPHRAIELLTRVIDKDSMNLDARFALAWRYFQVNNFKAMLDEAAYIIESRPTWSPAWNLHGLALTRLSKRRGRRGLDQEVVDRAVVSYRTAYAHSAGDEGILLNLIELLLQAGRTDQALTECTAVLAAHADSARVQAMAASVFFRLGKTDQALTACQRALELNSSAWTALYHRARYYADQPGHESHRRALQDFERALQAIPDDPWQDGTKAALLAGKAGVLVQLQDYAAAAAAYTNSLVLASNEKVRFDRALAYYAQGKSLLALHDCDQVVDRASRDLRLVALNRRACVHRQLGHFEEALRDHERVLAAVAEAQAAGDRGRVPGFVANFAHPVAARAVTLIMAGNDQAALVELDRAAAAAAAQGANWMAEGKTRQAEEMARLEWALHLMRWETLLLSDESIEAAVAFAQAGEALTRLPGSSEQREWCAKLMAFLIGDMTADSLLAAARCKDETSSAHYYIAIDALVQHDRQRASEQFAKCIAVGNHVSNEHDLALGHQRRWSAAQRGQGRG